MRVAVVVDAHRHEPAFRVAFRLGTQGVEEIARRRNGDQHEERGEREQKWCTHVTNPR